MLNQFIGQNLADKYQIDEVLRDSGLGKIYRATHLMMDKHVTVKILPPALAIDENIVKQFSAEARTVSHISHPNILNVTDFGSDKNGAVFMVMEDADGETLKQIIEREGKFPVDRAVKITYQIAAALSAAHSNGVIHHHLNTENILIANSPHEIDAVKVLDFGSDSVYENSVIDEEVADSTNLQYLSPEQNSSISEADERSDVYSLGVILYEMLAGEVPFASESSTDLMLKQAENPPAPLSAFRSDLPEYIEPIVIKALAKNPEMRYQTAQEFSNVLNRVSANPAESKTVILTDDPGLSNNLWKTAFIVLVGVVGMSAAMIYFTQSKQTNPTTQLQTDANGQPVQPLNPATGMNEQGSGGFVPYSSEMMTNSNMSVPQPIPNSDGFGDGYNPWASGRPPEGAPPMYVQPGGQVYTIPGEGSQFMPPDGGYILVPQPPNANVNANVSVKPSPSPKGTTNQANTQAQPSPTPAEKNQSTPETKAVPTPETKKTPTKPAGTPEAKPKTNPPASTGQQIKSGKEQDS